MGTNVQAMLRASSSAEEADEGGRMPEGFPFTVISGGEGEEAGAEVPVNPVFVAYAKRAAAPARTAREALAFALAATEGGGAEDETRQAGGGERVDEASYGVTRSPFARVSAPVAAAPAGIIAEAPPTTAKVESAPKRRPTLREEVAAPPPVRVAETVQSPAEAAAVVPEAGAPMAEAAVPVIAPVAAAASVAGFTPEAEAGEVAAEAVSGKLKISARRGVQSAAPMPGVPPPDAPFLFGPVMDGTRSPLMPLPVSSGEPGAPFMPPVHAMTRSPFPAVAGVPAGGAGLAPLAMGKAGRPPEGRRAGATRAGRSGAGPVWRGRLAAVGATVAVLVLAGYFLRQSPYWPFGMKTMAVASTPVQQDEASVSAAETAGRSALPSRSVTTAAVATSAASAAAARPVAGAAFVGVLESLKITGVLQGEPVRAIIDGRLVQAGDLVEVTREVRLVGLDVAGRQLIFEDRTKARASVRY